MEKRGRSGCLLLATVMAALFACTSPARAGDSPTSRSDSAAPGSVAARCEALRSFAVCPIPI
jgi:hypothetical protein